MWGYDSQDWQVSTGAITPKQVDAYYQALVDDANNGTFGTEGAIILTHEINSFTMDEAIDWYPRLKDAFKVGLIFRLE